MAQLPLYLLTAVDVRRAGATGTSRAITISKLALPAIKFMTTGHNPGGGVGEVNFVQPRIEAPEPKFDGKGIDTDAFKALGQRDRWVFAGAYRDKKSGKAIPSRAIIEATISSWEPDESDPSDFQGCSHVFSEVTHYELSLDGEELWYWDCWERVMRSGGVDMFADDRQALGG